MASTQTISDARRHLVIVGGGINGLAHAILAAEQGEKVTLLEEAPFSMGASARNFGLITVTGQRRGEVWERSLRSMTIWEGIAARAGLDILQHGMVVTAQSEDGKAVLDAFLNTEMGEACQMISTDVAIEKTPLLKPEKISAAMFSPHERRVESRHVLPKLARYAQRLGVDLRFNAPVAGVGAGGVQLCSGERIQGDLVILCAGANARRFVPPDVQNTIPYVTKLHMLRAVPTNKARWSASVVSELTLGRYSGFADLDAALPLKARLKASHGAMLDDGIHIIGVQSADGSLVLGDSHHDCAGDQADPFQPADVDDRIMQAASEFLDLEGAVITERWTGAYTRADHDDWLIREVDDGVWLTAVLGGKGMTLGFGFAELSLQTMGLLPAIRG